jgi:hypothetical protein
MTTGGAPACRGHRENLRAWTRTHKDPNHPHSTGTDQLHTKTKRPVREQLWRSRQVSNLCSVVRALLRHPVTTGACTWVARDGAAVVSERELPGVDRSTPRDEFAGNSQPELENKHLLQRRVRVIFPAPRSGTGRGVGRGS